ncbi:MAG: hypothetical protein J6U03_02780 [Muribaculaceae bacterium]|nr:hypothetical protein [Muribaculaceae bacterium]
MEVVYEDNHIIIVNKAPGEVVQGDKSGSVPLLEIVREWIRVKYAKPCNVFLGLVHRIDRPVGGLVVFAKTSKALTRMNNLFREGKVKKTYLAIVHNRPPKDEDRIECYLHSVERFAHIGLRAVADAPAHILVRIGHLLLRRQRQRNAAEGGSVVI